MHNANCINRMKTQKDRILKNFLLGFHMSCENDTWGDDIYVTGSEWRKLRVTVKSSEDLHKLGQWVTMANEVKCW